MNIVSQECISSYALLVSTYHTFQQYTQIANTAGILKVSLQIHVSG